MATRVVLDDGAELAVTTVDDPTTKVTVVLAHSHAQDHRVRRTIVGALRHATERPAHALAYDRRGHGPSSAATGDQLCDSGSSTGLTRAGR